MEGSGDIQRGIGAKNNSRRVEQIQVTVATCDLNQATNVTSIATASENVAHLHIREKVSNLAITDIELTEEVKEVLAIP